VRSEDSKRQQREACLKAYRLFASKCHHYLGGDDPCCVDCGSTDSLEISHNDPSTKLFDILAKGKRAQKYWDAIVRVELDKCSLRCEPCHLKHDGNVPAERGADGLPVHGTDNRYQLGCRCDLCREAMLAAKRVLYGSKKRTSPQHGTISGYSHGCRCPECKRSHSEYALDYYYRKKIS